MSVLFATMGYTPGLVVAPLRQFRDIRELHIFFTSSKDPQHPATLDSVRKVSETFGVKLHEHRLKDGFDFDEALRTYVRALDTISEKEEVKFNASSGPRPMIMAATIFCSTHDIPLHYYDEYDTKGGKVIPLRAYQSLRGLGDSKKALLQRLQKKGPTDVSTLSAALKLAASTVSAHVHELVEMGLVTVQRDGKRQVVTIEPGVHMFDMEAVS